jgi:hypothetical protein
MWRRVHILLTDVSEALVHRSWISYTLKMEAIRSSETSVNKISTRRHIPEDGILHELVKFSSEESNIWRAHCNCIVAFWRMIQRPLLEFYLFSTITRIRHRFYWIFDRISRCCMYHTQLYSWNLIYLYYEFSWTMPTQWTHVPLVVFTFPMIYPYGSYYYCSILIYLRTMNKNLILLLLLYVSTSNNIRDIPCEVIQTGRSTILKNLIFCTLISTYFHTSKIFLKKLICSVLPVQPFYNAKNNAFSAKIEVCVISYISIIIEARVSNKKSICSSWYGLQFISLQVFT